MADVLSLSMAEWKAREGQGSYKRSATKRKLLFPVGVSDRLGRPLLDDVKWKKFR